MSLVCPRAMGRGGGESHGTAFGPGRGVHRLPLVSSPMGAARLEALKCVDTAGGAADQGQPTGAAENTVVTVRPQRQKLSGVRGNLPAETALRGRACDRPMFRFLTASLSEYRFNLRHLTHVVNENRITNSRRQRMQPELYSHKSAS